MNGYIEPRTLIGKTVVFLIRIVLPAIVLIFLLGVSQYIPREKLGSEMYDFGCRIVLSLLFSLSYFFMPFLSKGFWFFTFPKMERSNIVIYPQNWLLSMLMVFGRFIVFGVLTKLTIDTFFPVFNYFSLLIAIANGLVFALPTFAQYIFLKKTDHAW